MSASERGGYCLSSELKRNLDGGSLAVQRLNSCDYLSADVRQMLYGFSSVSNLFNICGLSFSTEDTEGHGGGLTKTKTITFTGGCVVSAPSV